MHYNHILSYYTIVLCRIIACLCGPGTRPQSGMLLQLLFRASGFKAFRHNFKHEVDGTRFLCHHLQSSFRAALRNCCRGFHAPPSETDRTCLMTVSFNRGDNKTLAAVHPHKETHSNLLLSGMSLIPSLLGSFSVECPRLLRHVRRSPQL